MPKRPSEKTSDILEQAERILVKKLLEKSYIPDPWPPHAWVPKETSPRRHEYLGKALLQNWLKIFDEARSFPRSEFHDDVTELRRETDALRANMEALHREVASTKNEVQVLSQEVLKLRSDEKTEILAINELCIAYIEEAKSLDVVREVLLSKSEDENVPIIWTIIEAPPFEDSLRIPIYEAQLRILKSLKEDTLLDFHVLNLSELSENQSMEDVVPPEIDILWQR